MPADLRFALRGIQRSPGLALVAVISLTLGIGANTAIFSLVNALLLRPLPVREPGRLVIFTLSTPDRYRGNSISPSLFQAISGKSTLFDGLAATSTPPIGPPMTLSAGGTAERVEAQLVSGNFFQTLGLDAAAGRLIAPEDDRIPGGQPVCVISYSLWQRRFGGEPGVIGRPIQINGRPFTVLGVTPEDFASLSPELAIDVAVPLATADFFKPYRPFLQPFGRLKPGVTAARAQAALDALYHQSIGRDTQVRVVLQPGSRGISSLRGQYERPLTLLMVVVGLVLLIACANVANLLMARASGRAGEIAVRLALGASRIRLVRQLLSESLVFTVAGAALGMALAYWADGILVALAPHRIHGGAPVIRAQPDWRVLLFTLGLAMLVTVLAGLAPALQATRPDPGVALKGGGGVSAPGRFSFANILVVAQVALSLVLLIGAGLFLRSLHNLKSVDPGFDPGHMVVMTLEPLWDGYSGSGSQEFFDRLVERAATLPGVAAASTGMVSPFSGDVAMTSIEVPGYQPQPNDGWTPANPDAPWMMPITWIGPDYFKTLGAPPTAGRPFTWRDGRDNKVAIVSQKTASHFWPHENPLRKRILIGGRDADDCEVVGVVRDLKSESLRAAAPATVYMPFPQSRRRHVTLHVRVSNDPRPVTAALLRLVRELDPTMVAYNVTTVAAQLDRTMAPDRLMAALTALFGVVAVVLAAVGLYGVMAFTVAARTREIGIRMALGADRARVLRQVIAKSAALAAAGIAIGIPVALWASRGIGSFLFGLSPNDPWTYALLSGALGAVSLSAAWIPARRAAKVDPMVSLRYE